jgi:osmoprotectant transport system ATP-binding protein
VTPYLYLILRLTEISKSYQNSIVLNEVSFSVEKGQTLCLIGPSGSGKSTLLKIINGLEEPDGGTVSLFGNLVADQDGINLRRRIGFVLQEPALFPHYSVEQNIEIVPKLLKWKSERRRRRTEELLELMGLPYGEYAKRYPAELSGGEKQRVGIARALAADPEIILFDEPFSALDPITRSDLQQELLRLKEKLKKTSVFVTHDVREAFLLGDRIVILNEGKVEQEGTPEEIKAAPKTEFVQRFIQLEEDA